MGTDLGGDVSGKVNRHGQHAQVNALGERADIGPILAVQDADVVVRLAEPGGEEAAHLTAPADDEHLGPRPDAAPPERVQLPDA